MKVLIFLPSTGRGGCEQAAVHLADELCTLGNEVSVCHPLVPETALLRTSFEAVGCNYIRWRCGERSRYTWPTDKDQSEEAVFLLRETRPDVVVLVLPEPTSAFGVFQACLEAQKRTFVIFQLCAESFSVPAPIFDITAKLHANLAPTYISVSSESVGRLAKCFHIDPSSIHVLPNFSGHHLLDGITDITPNVKHHRSIPIGYRTIVTVGRITKQKGYEYLVEAASLVTSFVSGVHFVWVGGGEDDFLFRKLITERELDSYFTLTGWSDDVGSYLRAADVFVLPSLWEGTPLAISEAMAFGCPIIASDVGGIPEMLSTDEGWLAKAGDAKELGRIILLALENPILSKVKAENARLRWLRDSEESKRQLISLITC